MTTPNLNDYDGIVAAAEDYSMALTNTTSRNSSELSTKTPGCSTSMKKAVSSRDS